jgi:hypothetical protein
MKLYLYIIALAFIFFGILFILDLKIKDQKAMMTQTYNSVIETQQDKIREKNIEITKLTKILDDCKPKILIEGLCFDPKTDLKYKIPGSITFKDYSEINKTIK